jgi:cell division protein FtsL
MAAFATTYFETGRSWATRIAEHNAALMAQQVERRRRVRTPEFFFARSLDNSRLIKAADPVRIREMRVFSAAAVVLLSLVMFYGLQHFYAIESSYRIETEKQSLDQLREENRQLRLSEAELTQPGRIDQMARSYGLTQPQAGQVIVTDSRPASGAPVLAQVSTQSPAAQ